MSHEVLVIGAGLAGSEAAWQIVSRGVPVRLYEMRPEKQTPAHSTEFFAELVCSNSLRGDSLTNAVGLLKEEMRRLGSLVIHAADTHRVPAGGALAVDRERFSRMITAMLRRHPLVTVVEQEMTRIPTQRPVVMATGPLTSDDMARAVQKLTGDEHLYFYDAVAPILTLESVNLDRAYWLSRYGKGDPAYLNCPLSRAEYDRFWEALVSADRAPLRDFEKEIYFEGCMPVEVLAARGRETLLFGPLKPVGLEDPRTGERPHAVVQLRKDNREGTLLNMVGFQTHLKWGEQKRVFGMIPALENAEFVRYGVMHRNTFINAPVVLGPTLECRESPGLFFAGQMSGVEGYVESAASGLLAGINAARRARNADPVAMPPETAHGALVNYIMEADPKRFQPMNVTFGLFPALPARVKSKKERYLAYSRRALEGLAVWMDEVQEQSVSFD